jgi:hypothetical protein
MNYTSISNDNGGIGQGGGNIFDFGICLDRDFYDLSDYWIFRYKRSYRTVCYTTLAPEERITKIILITNL